MRTLFIDIETRPALAYVWRLHKENIGVEQIVEPTGLMCFAAKWKGDRNVIFRSVWEDGKAAAVREAHRLLDSADAVVHYYGSAFDVPMLNAEFIKQGLGPPAPFHQIDLKKAVDRIMLTTSTKLAFIAPFLEIGEKVKHEGFELWRLVLEGDTAAQTRMKRYNVQDTKLLEPLYEKLLPWLPDHPNVNMFEGNAEEARCPKCGSDNLQSRGFRYNTTYAYRRFQCRDCGAWMRERASTKLAGGKASMRGL